MEYFYKFLRYIFLELKTETVLGTVIAGLTIPAILFVASVIKARLNPKQIWINIKKVFSSSIKLYQICLIIILWLIIKFIFFVPQKSSAISEQDQLHEKYIDSISRTKIGTYSYEEIQELLQNVDKNYFGISAFIDYRDSLDNFNGTRLKWHDSDNNEMEVFSPEFKSKLLSLSLIKLTAANSYVLTEYGRLYFWVRDKIEAHNSQYYSRRNKLVLDSLSKIKPVN